MSKEQNTRPSTEGLREALEQIWELLKGYEADDPGGEAAFIAREALAQPATDTALLKAAKASVVMLRCVANENVIHCKGSYARELRESADALAAALEGK